jgi:hypothetical protein
MMPEVRTITLGEPALGIKLANDWVIKSDDVYQVISVKKGEVLLYPKHSSITIRLFADRTGKLTKGYYWLQIGRGQPIACKPPNIPFLLRLLST